MMRNRTGEGEEGEGEGGAGGEGEGERRGGERRREHTIRRGGTAKLLIVDTRPTIKSHNSNSIT